MLKKLLLVAFSMISVNAMATSLPPAVVEASCKLQDQSGTVIASIYKRLNGYRFARFEGSVDQTIGGVEKEIIREFSDSIKGLLAMLTNIDLRKVNYIEHYRMKPEDTEGNGAWLIVVRDQEHRILGQVLKLGWLMMQCE